MTLPSSTMQPTTQVGSLTKASQIHMRSLRRSEFLGPKTNSLEIYLALHEMFSLHLGTVLKDGKYVPVSFFLERQTDYNNQCK